MRVLVTNDDGIHARGIAVLAECAAEVFEEVVVVAPDAERSGVSQSLSLHRPLRLDRHADDRYSVDGTPVDAVFVALAHVMRDRRPDLVLSGINHGPNVGYDIYYSGTVGAAREALIHGIPSVALSLSARHPLPFDELRPAVIEVLRRVRHAKPDTSALLNVNFPPVRDDREPGWLGLKGVKGLKTTTLGRRFYGNEIVYREDPRGRPYFWIGGAWPRIEQIEGTDCDAVRQGWVSVTPLGLDATELTAFDNMSRVFDSDRDDDGGEVATS
jgi:5'-nucleotidase